MEMRNLSDEQWCLLDVLMRARETGVHQINRMELMNSGKLPKGVLLRLTFAALTMPKDLVAWVGQHDFSITDDGVALYNLRFNTPEPTSIGDHVICLPGPDHYRQ